jgi:hypothetical protein
MEGSLHFNFVLLDESQTLVELDVRKQIADCVELEGLFTVMIVAHEPRFPTYNGQ